MQYKYSFSFCMLEEKKVVSSLMALKKEYPEIHWEIQTRGVVQAVHLFSSQNLEKKIGAFQNEFKEFFFGEESLEKALHLAFIRQKKTLVTAESCTGGAVAARLVEMEDASLYFLGGFVAYTNEWKEKFLHVSPKTLLEKGAVSSQAIQEMLAGVFKEIPADFAVAISGIAGPAGGTKEKPVGTVYVGVGRRGDDFDIGKIEAGKERLEIIDYTVVFALSMLYRRVSFNRTTFL